MPIFIGAIAKDNKINKPSPKVIFTLPEWFKISVPVFDAYMRSGKR
jgi:hypothetical protein